MIIMRVLLLSAVVLLFFSGAFAHAQTTSPAAGGQAAKTVNSGPQPVESFTNSIEQTFVYIKPGSFMMGSPVDELKRSEDELQHRVTITKGHYMQTTEVTQQQWQTIMENNPAFFKECGASCPVESVSWDDVQKFLETLNQWPGEHRYRLPTEAEWEYAARAGTTGPFAGNSLDSMGWYKGNSGDTTHPVGLKAPNAWGLYDMHGNVSEWVQDWYGEYPAGSVIDPKGRHNGFYRIARGGGWDMPFFGCRSAQRIISGQGNVDSTRGFRLVAEYDPAKKQLENSSETGK
jgi:formylglycine-generating enzyme required for sulfatase activity